MFVRVPDGQRLVIRMGCRGKMWCLIIIGVTLFDTYILPNMGSHNYYYQTPHPQTSHP